MFTKICGTTNLPDAALAVALGANALGFLFAPSKRRVTLERAAAITQILPPAVERVGVFTEADAAEIVRTVAGAGLTTVQMHWSYDRETVRALRSQLGPGVRLWQVVGYPAQHTPPAELEERFRADLQDAFLDDHLAAVLVDAVQEGRSGGQGVPFAWERAAQAVARARAAASAALEGRPGQTIPPLVLAGGLHAQNVGEAIRTMRPWGVDVVSGVEASPGRKDPERLRAFLERAREEGEASS